MYGIFFWQKQIMQNDNGIFSSQYSNQLQMSNKYKSYIRSEGNFIHFLKQKGSHVHEVGTNQKSSPIEAYVK